MIHDVLSNPIAISMLWCMAREIKIWCSEVKLGQSIKMWYPIANTKLKLGPIDHMWYLDHVSSQTKSMFGRLNSFVLNFLLFRPWSLATTTQEYNVYDDRVVTRGVLNCIYSWEKLSKIPEFFFITPNAIEFCYFIIL